MAVAETLHFGHAAEDCDMSQPGLSSQISNLERVLGVQLVERTTRRVLLTAAGERVVDSARRIVAELENLETQISKASTPLSGSLRLGVIPTVAPYLLPQLLPSVRERFPVLQLFLREEQTDRLVDMLDKGRIDMALMALPSPRPSHFTEVGVGREAFHLAMPASHRLAGRSSVRPSDIAGEDVLLLESGHCLRDQALSVCDRSGAIENSTIQANSIATLVQMVANGLGVTLLPTSAVRSELHATTDVVARPFEEPQPHRTLGLVARKSSALNEEMTLLSTLFKSYEGIFDPIPIVKSMTSS
jgi:LysR family transcriptional regulator, hydrogen peroxide-inducible genes activator